MESSVGEMRRVTNEPPTSASSSTTAGTDNETVEHGLGIRPAAVEENADWSNDPSDRCNLIVNYLPHEIEDLSLKVLLHEV
jgi:hypothetical protein